MSILENGVMTLPWNQLKLRTLRIDSRFASRGTTLTITDKIWNKINNSMINVRLPVINFKPEYKKAYTKGTIDLSNTIVAYRYHKEVAETYFIEFKKLLDSSSNNRYKLIRDDTDYLGFSIKKVNVNPEDNFSVRITFIKDINGWITGFEVVDPMMEQSSLVVEDILAHVGVKGMRWGVRKSTIGAQEVIVRNKGKKLKTSGGSGHPAHPDAVRARKLGQIGKKSGLKSLSDQELRTYANRLQLEQNVSRLNFNEKSAPRRFVATLLGKQGSQLANEATKSGATKVGKSALNAATRKSIKVARIAAA